MITGETTPPGAEEPLQTPSVSFATGKERVVSFRPRTVLMVLGVLLAVVAALGFLLLAQKGLTVIAIALFLALALNPAVEFFQRRGLGRGLAVAAVYGVAFVVFLLLALVFIPPLVIQIRHFITSLPDLVQDLTGGRGPFGWLERRFHVVEQVKKLTSKDGSASFAGAAIPALGIAKGVATVITNILIIAFLTLFMLLEGPGWRRTFTNLIPETRRSSVQRMGSGVYKSVSGFVSGNLLASLLAGVVATVLLLIVRVPYPFPLGLFTAIIELVPYIGPVVVTVLLTLVALTVGPISAIIVFVLLVLYHLIEGHTVRPLIYGRALKLSPLAVLIAIILGTEIAGVLGTLAAIPVAGSIQAILSELLDQREQRRSGRTSQEKMEPDALPPQRL